MVRVKAVIEHKINIHIMDLKELMRFIEHSKGDRNIFDYFLMQRIEQFAKKPMIGTKSEFKER